MTFHPKSSPIPRELRRKAFKIRQLLTTDVEKDYEAVMATQEKHLKNTEGRWPKEGFSLNENLKDLERHQKMHGEEKEFTFTVMSPDESLCLGCIYINPLGKELKVKFQDRNWSMDHVAILYYWLRPDYSGGDYEQNFVDELVRWMKDDWDFSQVFFSGKHASEPELEFLENAGLTKKFQLGKNSFFV
ncbi:MAG: hypothetical protein ACXAB7_02605 [Candidatus Kariarchaeaceae archaeon]|jgi:RimJ/RimL family protein N-acetyltransferase